MIAKEAIHKILSANSVGEVFPKLGEWQQQYKDYMRVIHPDICIESNCKEATAKLNLYKEELERGKKHNDDAGSVIYTLNSVKITGEKELIQRSIFNYNYLMSLKDEAAIHFKKYLPASIKILSDVEIEFTLPARAVPLSSLGTLEQKHSNWVLSRMLEFAGWINQCGFSHAGINPDSIYVIPENHGMVCISFYHMTRLNQKLSTISAKYQGFYPAHVFTSKKAVSNIDIDLCKRTAIYLLGDKSGSGVILRKDHKHPEMLSFLLKQQDDPIETYKVHRDLLKKHFDTKQFHVLNV